MRPLEGQSVIVTRPGDSGAELAIMLEGLGATVSHIPAIAIEMVEPTAEVEALCQGADHVILSSGNSLPVIVHLAEKLGDITIWAAGETTAKLARDAGFEVSLVSEEGGLADLVACSKDVEIDGKVVLWPTSGLATGESLKPLTHRGAEVRTFEAYQNTNPLTPGSVDLDGVTAIVFASPSALKNFESALSADDLDRARENVRSLSIGKTTARALRRRHWQQIDVAARPSNEGLLALALEHLSGGNP